MCKLSKLPSAQGPPTEPSASRTSTPSRIPIQAIELHPHLSDQEPISLHTYTTMGDVAVESPANSLTPLPKPGALDNLANLDSLEGVGADGNDEYATLKRLQRHLE